MGSFKTSLFKATSIVLGEAHFIAQSTADAIVHTEGYLGSKLTDKSKAEIIAERRAITKEQQVAYKACAKTFGKTFKNKFKAVPVAPAGK